MKVVSISESQVTKSPSHESPNIIFNGSNWCDVSHDNALLSHGSSQMK